MNSEDKRNISRLALRLQLNGIHVQDNKDNLIMTNDSVDIRVHPSRRHQCSKEKTLGEIIKTPEILKEVESWGAENWSTLQVSSVESELSDGRSGTGIKDCKPIIYGKIKGVMAKLYIDQGAQVSVISETFVQSNGMNMTVLRKPVKLQMANGFVEPSFNMVHSVAFSTGEPLSNDSEQKEEEETGEDGTMKFAEKINAFVAPIKGYDAIIGRDDLKRWGAILDLRSEEDRNIELEDSGIKLADKKNELLGLSVYDKKRKMRIHLHYGRNDFINPLNIDKCCVDDRALRKILEKEEEMFLYEVSVEEVVKANNLKKNDTDTTDTMKGENEKTLKEKISSDELKDDAHWKKEKQEKISVEMQNENERNLEEKMKREFEEIMREELPDELPPDRGIRHYIDTQGKLPKQARRGFRMSVAENEFMQCQIQTLLDKGLIVPSLGPYGSPILVVKKPHSTDLRCVIDYRKLNEVTVGDEYPQPLVGELLDKLKNAKYFSKMDLLSGFHQIKMAEEDKSKTAFTSPFGTFAFEVMPLGLKNASKTFQRMVEYVLRDYIGKSVIVFIDDILVFSESLEEHEKHLKEVLEKMKQHKLYLKPKKCEFFRKTVAFLGHVVSHNEVKMDPKKVQVVKDWGELETKKDVQRFLGFANFYRRFIENFAKVAEPLNAMLCNTKDNTKLMMTNEARKAQRELIEMIIKDPILKMYDGKKELKIVTDSSLHAVAATLLQQEEDKTWHPVEFQSRALEGNKERKTGEYSLAPRDLELCGISYALTKFRPYVAGKKFTVISDHKSLEVLEKSKINSGRLARIIEQLAEFDFKIEYKEGTSPIISVVDALSRLPRYRKVLDDDEEERTQELALCEIFGLDALDTLEETTEQWGASILLGDPCLLEQIKEGYSSDEYFVNIVNNLTKLQKDKDFLPPKEMKFLLSRFEWDAEQSLLYKKLDSKRTLCIPRTGSLVVDRIFDSHDTPLGAHMGRDKTLALVSKNFFWPGMVKDVEDYVRSCENCQRNKGCKRFPLGLLYPHERPKDSWEKISLDFIVQLPKTKVGGYDAILTVVDAFSKRMHFIPCFSNVNA